MYLDLNITMRHFNFYIYLPLPQAKVTMEAFQYVETANQYSEDNLYLLLQYYWMTTHKETRVSNSCY